MLPNKQQNVGGDGTTEGGNCSVCEDLLANLQRFLDVLKGARSPSDSEWMTVEEVAQELRISKSIVYRIIRSGDLAAVDIVDASGHIARKGHYRIKRASLREYLALKQVKPVHNQIERTQPRRYPRVKNHLGL